ncbi:MAG TPA: helix-turn-helix domain-containing protein [Stackebrandtia sp.]|uniref:helix-turn-helix transcriptional regulator n=1 Tax=Stackebrandtia sp. TaxID=2023065 RepID=UPI002D39FB6C|nr:helix-turn-helix domain-containing protein [Stackebrandtia sp.]HZE39600.1 helix-turn-helix domain-containing protein [Stackebrandtia sp.]
MNDSFDDRVSALAALDEPTRRRLFEYVSKEVDPVSRDEAAEALDLPRPTIVFHLDKLVHEGLLDVVFARRNGRDGPGAGRPSKLYKRSTTQLDVSIPPRRYDMAAELLADAVEESDRTGVSARDALRRLACDAGRDLATGGATGERGLIELLESFGFEPREIAAQIALGNCPFHSLVMRHAALVCDMNLGLVEGMIDGAKAEGLRARLNPSEQHCCVRLSRAKP